MTNPISVRPAELTRALATVEQVVSLHDIPDADNIVRARIRGWDVVVKRDEFYPGDRCLYVEVDAMLDTTDPRFAFLEPRGVRTTLEGRRGHVLKTARLRGQYSQGLALPLAAFPEVDQSLPVGADVTDLLQIVKWDPPIAPELAGKVRGLRPSWITATDEERLQNLSGVLDSRDVTWIATEKIDGCLQARTRVDMADGSKKSIPHVVVGDLVLGMDTDGRVVPTEVSAIWRHGRTEDWLHVSGRRLRAGRGNSLFSLTLTPNHRVWDPESLDYVEARNLREGSQVLTMRSERRLSPLQRSVILGKLLGDGTIVRSSPGAWNIEWAHRHQDSDYTRWTARACGWLAGSFRSRRSGYGTDLQAGRTVPSHLIKQQFDAFWSADFNRKVVPESVVDDLDPIALAFWYMDDGSLSHSDGQEDRCVLSTSGFTDDEHKILIRALARLGIEASCFASRGHLSLRLTSDAAEKLFLLVAPYVPAAMQRKLPVRYRGGEGWLPEPDREYKPVLVPVVVDSVRSWSPKRGTSGVKFDITTGTANFFANGTLVHNSSTTFYADPLEDYHGVCSRNLDLLRTDGHTMWSLGDQLSVHERLSETFPGQRAVVQGETYGEGIQGNPLRLRGHHFAAFTLWVAGREIPRGQWPSWLQDLSVPTRDFAFPSSLEQALEQVETLKSALAPERAAEGLVWRAADRADVTVDGRPVRASFKVVSNRYLLRHDR